MSAPSHPLLPGAEPFEFEGKDDLGVLLVHGFTGTPFTMAVNEGLSLSKMLVDVVQSAVDSAVTTMALWNAYQA